MFQQLFDSTVFDSTVFDSTIFDNTVLYSTVFTFLLSMTSYVSLFGAQWK